MREYPASAVERALVLHNVAVLAVAPPLRAKTSITRTRFLAAGNRQDMWAAGATSCRFFLASPRLISSLLIWVFSCRPTEFEKGEEMRGWKGLARCSPRCVVVSGAPGGLGKKMSKNDVGSRNMHENKGKSGIMSAELSGLYT